MLGPLQAAGQAGDGSAPEAPAALVAADVSKSFGALRVVDGFSFSFSASGITGLIGPNGAGKTTLFNLLAGTLRPDAGTIRFLGERLDGLPMHAVFARGLARTFQIPRPFAELSVLDNLMVVPETVPGRRFFDNWLFPAGVRARERQARERAEEILAFVTLLPLAHEPARVLSGGQQKLLELARVMMGEPRMILLDEPAAGVNPALLETIVDRIVQLNRRGIGFLMIEHNVELVARICDPVVAMARGRILAAGDAASVRAAPEVVEAYLGGTP